MQKEQQLRSQPQLQNQQQNQYDPFKAPETIHYRNEFLKEHEWYNPKDQDDTDSQILSMLDSQIAREGYNPTSPAYWNELRRRAKELMPDRYDNYEPQKTTPVQPSTTAQQSQPVAGKQQIRLRDLTPQQRNILVRQGHIGTDGSIKNKEKVTYYVTQWYKNK
jgi:type IV secretory pathway VirB10-like protein